MVVLVVVGAYLGIMVSSEMARAATLQNQLNALKTNYTTLESQYAQLQNQYTTLQTQYDQLQSQYNGLESNYTALQSQYNQLKVNYTDVTSAISLYASMIGLTAYAYVNQSMNGMALFVNITNPTSKPMNVTVGATIEDFKLLPPTTVFIPPHASVLYPILITLSGSFISSISNWGGGIITGSTVNSTLKKWSPLLVLFTNNLTNIGVPGFAYNASMVRIIWTNSPFGYAIYYLGSSLFNLYLGNPLSSAVAINGYAVYSYNGTLLTSCMISPAITINATTIVYGMLIPTINETSYSTQISVMTPTAGLPPEEISFSTTCTVNYQFPASVAQLPYGYVVLNTSVGNVTILLVPNPS